MFACSTILTKSLDFLFLCLIHFELIFVYDIKEESNFIRLPMDINSSQCCLLKGQPFPHCVPCPPPLSIIGLFLGSMFGNEEV